MSTSAALSKQNEQNYLDQRQRSFKATIAVALVYAGIAVLVILATTLSQFGRTVLSGPAFPFVVTFVTCMIVIVLILFIVLISWKKPVAAEGGLVKGDYCPDYWMTYNSQPDAVQAMNTAQQPYGKITCIPNADVFPIITPDPLVEANINRPATLAPLGINPKHDLFYLLDDVNGTVDNPTAIGASGAALSCSTIYPDYMAVWDSQNHPENPIAVRCEWAKQCGVPWTSVCPAAPASG